MRFNGFYRFYRFYRFYGFYGDGAAHQKKRRKVFKAPSPREGAARRAGDRETGAQAVYLHIRDRLRNEATVSSLSNIFLMTTYPPAPRRRPLSVKGVLFYSFFTPRRRGFVSPYLIISSIFLMGRKRFLDFARNDDTREVIVLHSSFTILQKGASSRHSILRLWRAPSSRGCSAGR